MRKELIFPFDSKEAIDRKIKDIQEIVGEDNICYYEINNNVPELIIRCSKKQWKKLNKKFDFTKVYW